MTRASPTHLLLGGLWAAAACGDGAAAGEGEAESEAEAEAEAAEGEAEAEAESEAEAEAESESEAGCEPAPGTVCTVAGSGDCEEIGCFGGFGGDGGPPAEALLSLPQDLLIDGGTFYLVDWNNHRLRSWGPEGIIRTLAGNGFLGDVTPGPAREAPLNHPTGVVREEDGSLVLSAWHNSKVVRYLEDGGTIEHIAGSGARALNGDGGPAATAAFDLPTSVAFHPITGDLYVMDQANQMIRAIGADGTVRRVAGAPCVLGACAEGVDPVPCPAPNAGKLACDPALCSNAAGCPAGFGGDGGPATEARLGQPRAQWGEPGGRMAFADDGTLYFADTFNHRIRTIDPDGVIATIAGAGTPATGMTANCATGDYGGDGGPATGALLHCPVDVALDGAGELIFTDVKNHCVRAIDAGGDIRTVAGVCGEPGFDGEGGDATEAHFHEPFGLALDAGDNLYIVDTLNNRVRVVMR